ncbi:MAG TPA: beta-ketoacyl synthase N-terminal-like domain-containing protein [Stellaceae bacterium]|jgi:acyl transferase domain-containing protein/acyl carrier protein
MTDAALEPIAIVGLACRFPGAANAEEFWQNLVAGREAVAQLSKAQLRAAGVAPATLADPNYVPARAVLDGADLFDAGFFGMTPQEAEVTDPQHRIFLECAWEALEDAACDPRCVSGRVGLFAGTGMNMYLLRSLPAMTARARDIGEFALIFGNDKDFVATRAAYKLDLRGPAVALGTACSTSLVAVQMACQSLLTYQCDVALAGAATIQLPQEIGHLHQDGSILSKSGHCRPFDAAADGTVSGNGAGIVVLKRLADALADGDAIRAVIRGAAINNDGAGKVGFTAPSVDGQAECIRDALALAGVTPDAISYIEAHGTGTALGDPVEIAALNLVFADIHGGAASCPIGSVKSNLGHLDTAAGIAGLIKTVLALEHRCLPASINFTQPNPAIDFAGGPFYVNDKLAKWPGRTGKRIASVSSFGIGGTNAHVVIEEAPEAPAAVPATSWQILPLSARGDAALAVAAQRLADHLDTHSDLALADVAHTLQSGRRAFERRRIIVCSDLADAQRQLRAPAVASLGKEPPPVAFLFPGQGAQYAGMGRDLYAHVPVFRREIDRAAAALQRHGIDLCATCFDNGEALRDTALVQPALFALEYALAQTFIDWGITPRAMIGHSLGEYVAATIAGVFAFDDAFNLVTVRGRLMQALPPGQMLAVALPVDELRPDLSKDIAVAAVNTERQTVLSGPPAAIEAARASLAARGVDARMLETSHAFHSAMMEPILDTFRGLVAAVPRQPPAIPFLSNLTGSWITAEAAQDPNYWADHLRHAVRFAEGVGALTETPDLCLIEIGPGRALTGAARQHEKIGERNLLLNAMRRREDTRNELAVALEALGRLWAAGAPVRWEALDEGARRRRVHLPTYAFDHRRYNLVAPEAAAPSTAPTRTAVPPPVAVPGSRFSIPSWRRTVPPAGARASGRWLIFADALGLAESIARRVAADGGSVSIVERARDYERIASDRFAIRADRREDYDLLLDDLGGIPDHVVHFWNVTGAAALAIEDYETRAFDSLLHLSKALARRSVTAPLDLAIVADGVCDVTGAETLCPEKALLLGFATVLPIEHPNIACRAIDILPDDDALADRLMAELTSPLPDAIIAWRGPHRLARHFAPVELAAPDGVAARLRQSGVYLIIGGLGGLGGELAGFLARTVQAKLVLTSRTGLPSREEWPRLVAVGGARDADDGVAWNLTTSIGEIEASRAAIERELAIRTIDTYDRFELRFRALCAALVLDYLRGAGRDLPSSLRALSQRLRLQPKFERFLDLMLDIVAHAGALRRDGDRLDFSVPTPPDSRRLKDELVADFPGFRPLIDLVERCARQYGAALSGEIEAISVLFPSGGESLQVTVAKEMTEFTDHRVSRVLLREIVTRVLHAGANTGRTLRILEIGGGNGIITGVLAPALKGADVEYHFTDIGRSFVVAAERQARALGFDFMTFGTLDITRDPAAQGLQRASFDIIVGLDVVHATPSIRGTIANLRELLRPNGNLLLLESVKSCPWDNMIAGLAEGWWFAEDELRSGTPLLEIDAWDRAFDGLGFAASATFPRTPDRRAVADCALVAAQLPGPQVAGDEAAIQMAERIRMVQKLEEQGAEVMVVVADASSHAEMAAAVAAADQRFGALNGVLNAAMDMQSGTIQLKDIAVARREFAPKVAGTRIIDELLGDRAIDFVALCSSVTAITGGFGDLGYCAANSFIAAFAQRAARQRFTVAIDWDRWQGVGFARDYERWHERVTGRALGGGLSVEAGCEAFNRILAAGLSEVMVTAGRPLEIAIQRAESAGTPQPTRVEASARHPRPPLSTPYAAPKGDTERAIAEIWEQVLNIGGIGVDDNFADLGGDSLIGIQIASRLRERLQINFSARDLFERPTIAALAEHAATLAWARSGGDAGAERPDFEEGVV